MFGIGTEDGPARGARREVAIGDTRPCLLRSGEEPDGAQGLTLQHALPVAHDDQKVSRRRRGHRGRKHRDGDDGRHGGITLCEPDHDIRGHGMAQHGDASISSRPRVTGHAREVLDEPARRAVDQFKIAAQSTRVAAVTGKVEGHRGVAVPGKCEGERPHELLRAGKSMGNHHGGRPAPARRFIDRGRNIADHRRGDRDPLFRCLQLPERHHDEGSSNKGSNDLDRFQRAHPLVIGSDQAGFARCARSLKRLARITSRMPGTNTTVAMAG